LGRYRIAFFSGTGCTALVADSLEKALGQRGCETRVEKIAAGASSGSFGEGGSVSASADTLILLFPVYACTAPGPVMEWIKTLRQAGGAPAAVLSVSGGGEVSPNTASRVGALKALKQKGYEVFFEDSIAMPSNIAVATPERVSIQLINYLPEKAGAIADSVTEGAEKRMRPLIFDRFFAWAGRAIRPYSKRWGKRILVSNDCDGCGLCARQCSTGNIEMQNMPWDNSEAKIPVFGGRCCMCLGCFYSCPKKALRPKTGKSLIVEGFALIELLEKAKDPAGVETGPFPKSKVWRGIKKYLSE